MHTYIHTYTGPFRPVQHLGLVTHDKLLYEVAYVCDSCTFWPVNTIISQPCVC